MKIVTDTDVQLHANLDQRNPDLSYKYFSQHFLQDDFENNRIRDSDIFFKPPRTLKKVLISFMLQQIGFFWD